MMPIGVAVITPFVGRARELDLLAADIATVRGGRGVFTLIVGEPGIGKTRLAERVASLAGEPLASLAADRAESPEAGPDLDVHWGRCWQGGGAPAFWPWIQLLRSCLAKPLAPADAESIAWAAGSVRALVAGAGADGNADAPGSARQSDQARFRLFDAIANFLHAHARSRPLMLVLDDLHDADHASLLLLQFLARDIKRSRVLLVGTCREAEVRRSAILTTAFAALARESRIVALKGLGRQEVETFIDTLSPSVLDPHTKDEVCRLTEGNPFFVDEIVRGLALQPVARGLDAGPVVRGLVAQRLETTVRVDIPFTVKEAIRQRLVPVGDDLRSLLAAAAALGRDFELRLLARLVSLPVPECRAVLEQACVEGLVEAADAERRGWRFVHVLIRETLREDTRAPNVRELHLRIAGLLAEDRRDGLPVHTASLAHHLVAALPLPGIAVVLDALLASGQEAMASFAYEEAASNFAQAIDILEQARETATTQAASTRLPELLVRYGYALHCSGHLGKARETFRRAAGLLRTGSGGNAKLFANAVLGFGKVSETGAIDEELVELLDEGLVLVGDADSPLRASLLARLAMALYFDPNSTRCLVLGQRAVAMAERLGDARAHIDALVAQHLVLWRPGTAAARLKVAETLIALCERVGEKEAALEARLWRIADLIELGQIAHADRERRRYEADAEAARLPVHRWHAALLRSTFALLEGRVAESGQETESALAIGLSAELPNARAFHLAQMFQLRSLDGKLGLLEPSLRSAAASRPSMAVWTACAAEAALATGRSDDARRAYDRLAADGFATVPRDGMWLPCLAVLSRLASAFGDTDGAACLRDMLLPFRDAWVVAVTAISVPGPVRLFLGIVYATTGDRDAAVGHLETAAELGRILRLPALVTDSETELSRVGSTPQTSRVPSATTTPGEAVFRRGTDFWTLAAGGQALRMRDSKGLRFIHYLIENPERDFHVFELVTAVEGSVAAPPGLRDDALAPGREGDTGPMLDASALAAYKRRLREVRSDLAEAESFNDIGRVEKLRAERDFLALELATATGLGGRPRRSGSPSEQVRVRVTKVIGLAMRRIADANPVLGRVLAREIRTGTFCAYKPDPDRPIRWITRIE